MIVSLSVWTLWLPTERRQRRHKREIRRMVITHLMIKLRSQIRPAKIMVRDLKSDQVNNKEDVPVFLLRF